MSASVELEGWFGGVDFQMNLAFRVVERCKLLQWLGSSVEWNIAAIGVYDKAVVNSRLLFAQSDGLSSSKSRELLDWALRNQAVVDYKVLVVVESDFSSSNGGRTRKVEVAVSVSM